MHRLQIHQPQQQEQQQEQPEELPSYEETIETQFQKKYILKYPQIFARTIHAIDADTGQPAYIKKTRGFSGTKSQYYCIVAQTREEQLVWCSKRENEGLELVFSRETVDEEQEEPEEQEEREEEEEEQEQEEEEEMEIVGIDDVIGTTEALLDNKGEAAMASEYPQPLQEHDDVPPPPAYQENEANSHDQYQVRLISICPFPFVYDFEFSGSSQDGRLRWIRNHEEKSSAQQQEGPWSAFLCIERTSGRVLAEVVLKSKRDSGLGTLVIHGDLDPDMHEFLVVSAIAVVEEYPVRQASFLSQT